MLPDFSLQSVIAIATFPVDDHSKNSEIFRVSLRRGIHLKLRGVVDTVNRHRGYGSAQTYRESCESDIHLFFEQGAGQARRLSSFFRRTLRDEGAWKEVEDEEQDQANQGQADGGLCQRECISSHRFSFLSATVSSQE